MQKQLIVLILAMLPLMTMAGSPEPAEKAIRQVVSSAYIDGLQNMGCMDAVKAGFHSNFEMLINRDGQLTKLPIKTWIERVEQRKTNPALQNQPKVSGKFLEIDVTGDAAMVKLELYRENTKIFTDYLSLYRFGNDWKIVSKTYQMH